MKIKFNDDMELDIIEAFDEDTEETTSITESFDEGEIVEGDIFGETTTTIDFQFGNGSCIYGLPKGYFDIVEE